jgi:hypothetical protein
MKPLFSRIGLVMLLSFAGVVATAQPATAAMRMPVAGTFAGGGQFTGVISINRFEQQSNNIVAIGFVSGVLTRGSHALGTAVTGEVTWPVTVSSAAAAATQTASTVAPAQADCPVLSVALGPANVNLLGFQVSLGAVTLDLAGTSGTPLGDLVCQISAVLGDVAAVVKLLNSLLSSLTGLLGGLGL